MASPKEWEWRLLQALCQTVDAGLRERGAKALRCHRWVECERQLIFAAWNLIARPGRPVLRGELAAQLTRAGFPETDLDSLFEPLPSPAAVLARLLEERPQASGVDGGGEGR